MAHYSHQDNDNECFGIQIIGCGYIPWSPYGGLHVMDDFGNLIQVLPQFYYAQPGMDKTFSDFTQYDYH